MGERADIDAYFERIGFAGSIAPTLETLGMLHGQHVAAIAFETIDPLIGTPIRIEIANLQQKLLFDGRGGYALEHNLLAAAMLAELDFDVTLRAAYSAPVTEGDETAAEPDHVVLSVDLGSGTYLVDLGFGARTPPAPLRFRNGAEQATPLETYRLTEEGGFWTLETGAGEDWAPLYTIAGAVADDQLQAMNARLVSKMAADGRLRAARIDKASRLVLENMLLTTLRAGAEPVERQLASVKELREVLTGSFGLTLPEDERVTALLERIAGAGR
jgi:N-hydroxyarylamine O-acetyltransferase